MAQRSLPLARGIREIPDFIPQVQEATVGGGSPLPSATETYPLSTAAAVSVTMDLDAVLGLSSPISRREEAVHVAVEFVVCSEWFLAAPLQCHHDTTISAPAVEHFPLFSSVLFFFLRGARSGEHSPPAFLIRGFG
jgi:hypothetical protein